MSFRGDSETTQGKSIINKRKIKIVLQNYVNVSFSGGFLPPWKKL